MRVLGLYHHRDAGRCRVHLVGGAVVNVHLTPDELYTLLVETFTAGQNAQLHVNQRVDAAKAHADRVLRELDAKKTKEHN